MSAWGVYCLTEDGQKDWCLCWGEGSPVWTNTQENALDRAAKLTATSHDRTVYTASPYPDPL